MTERSTRWLAILLLVAGCKTNGDSQSREQPTTQTPTAPAAQPTPPSASPAPAAADPCSYVTREQVSAAIGVPISLVRPDGATKCSYFPETSATSNGLYVEVSDSGAYHSMKQMMHGTAPVTGLGDDAFWAAPMLRVKAGPRMVVVAVMDTRWNHGDSQGAAVAVARHVLSNL